MVDLVCVYDHGRFRIGFQSNGQLETFDADLGTEWGLSEAAHKLLRMGCPGTLEGIASTLRAKAAEACQKSAHRNGQDRRRIGGQELLEYLEELQLDLWVDRDRLPWVSLREHTHVEHHPMGCRLFRQWLTRALMDRFQTAISPHTVEKSLLTLEGWASTQGPYDTHLRVAYQDGRLYIDLGDPDWRAVEIDPTGWRIVSDHAVRFRRPARLLPLPAPERGGTLWALQGLSGVPEDRWPLVAGWLLGALHPTGPYPVLLVRGPEGSGKSTLARMLKSLIDPTPDLLRQPPKDETELHVSAKHNWICGWDNLSSIPSWASDALCRVSTGGGMGRRRLYTDSEEAVLDAKRPVILTSVTMPIRNSDLLSRTIPLELPPRDVCEDEMALWERFRDAAPRLLGALLDAASAALAGWKQVQVDRSIRMADFAKWAAAGEAALGLEGGSFLRLYRQTQQSAKQDAVELSPIGSALLNLLEEGDFVGSAKDLLETLAIRAGYELTRLPKTWPQNAWGMRHALDRLIMPLRSLGYEFQDDLTIGRGAQRRKVFRLGRKEDLAYERSGFGTDALAPGDGWQEATPAFAGQLAEDLP